MQRYGTADCFSVLLLGIINMTLLGVINMTCTMFKDWGGVNVSR